MKKIFQWIKAHLPTKRRLIQLYAALLFNANIKGFFNGRIYQGPMKNLCVPGLNCYSCPGASGSCPMGALQNAMASSGKTAPYYIFGILLLFGVLFGRWICGFLCPFGLIQDLLHKIPTPKLKKGKLTRILSYFKYVILAVFGFIIPFLYMFRDFPLPAFCKYFCPAGTLEGAIGLLSNGFNESYFRMLGPLFTWKFLLMVSLLVVAVFVYRVFCRFLCPLGALYGLFNRISIFGIKLDTEKCVDCGKCISKCKMDIRYVGDHECIGCGECIGACPTGAITWKGKKPVLAPNAFESETVSSAESARLARQKNETNARKGKIVKIVAAVLMVALLASALVYYNFIDKAPELTSGWKVGEVCYAMELPLMEKETNDFSDSFTISDTVGKITIINFWFTSCTPCVQEMPHFAEIAEKYGERVTVVAYHADMDDPDEAIEFVNKNWSDFNILFAYDTNNAYYEKLGGTGTYPRTLVLDGNNVVVAEYQGSLTYAELERDVESILAKQ